MAEQKTRPTAASVSEFIAAVPDERRRADTETAVGLVKDLTGTAPEMWGPSIVGFGSRHYRYASGTEGDTPRVGLSPRKSALTFYGLQDSPDAAGLLERLGPHSLGKGCVYIRDLGKVDADVLGDLIRAAWTADPTG